MRQNHQSATEQFVPVAVVARRYDIHRSTLWRLIRLGAIPAYRVGRRALRVKLTDVQAFVEHRQIAPGLARIDHFWRRRQL